MADPKTTVFLNQATAVDLAQLSGISGDGAEALVAGRPYRGWDDVQRTGINQDTVKQLQRTNVDFGEPSSGPLVEPGSGGSGGSPGGNLGRA